MLDKQIYDGICNIEGSEFSYFYRKGDKEVKLTLSNQGKTKLNNSLLKSKIIKFIDSDNKTISYAKVRSIRYDSEAKYTLYIYLFVSILKKYPTFGFVFLGRTINKMTQNFNFVRKISQNKKINKTYYETQAILDNKKCLIKSFTEIEPYNSANCNTLYASKLMFLYEEILDIDYILTSTLNIEKTIHFLTYSNTYIGSIILISKTDTNDIVQIGFVDFLVESNKNDALQKASSIENFLFKFENLYNFIKTIPSISFFLNNQDVSFLSDIISNTALSQIFFKKLIVPTNSKYSINSKYDVKITKRNGKKYNFPFQNQLIELFKLSLPYLQDFLYFYLYKIFAKKSWKNIINESSNHIKNIRNSFAHGITSFNGLPYTYFDSILLKSSVYCCVFTKCMHLRKRQIQKMIAELFLSIDEISGQYLKRNKKPNKNL